MRNCKSDTIKHPPVLDKSLLTVWTTTKTCLKRPQNPITYPRFARLRGVGRGSSIASRVVPVLRKAGCRTEEWARYRVL